jgi:hypothetical protein
MAADADKLSVRLSRNQHRGIKNRKRGCRKEVHPTEAARYITASPQEFRVFALAQSLFRAE